MPVGVVVVSSVELPDTMSVAMCIALVVAIVVLIGSHAVLMDRAHKWVPTEHKEDSR